VAFKGVQNCVDNSLVRVGSLTRDRGCHRLFLASNFWLSPLLLLLLLLLLKLKVAEIHLLVVTRVEVNSLLLLSGCKNWCLLLLRCRHS
jgi:hypothetical protein